MASRTNATSVRIDLNRSGVRDLLRGDAVQADLKRRADKIAQAAGPGHKVNVSVGRNRVRAEVVTDTFQARAREATGRSLTRAIDAGR